MAAAIAAPLVGILGSAGATIVANVALYAATTAVSYFLQQALMPEQKDPGIRAEVSFGESVSQGFIFGRCATAGSLVYANTYGSAGKTPNAYLVQVFCVSDLPCEGIASTIWVNNRKCTISGTLAAKGYEITQYPDDMWIYFLDGTQTTVNSYLSGKFGSDPDRPWSSDMIGRGRGLVIVTTRYDSEKFQGLPQFVFVIDGVKLYDPRLDGTNGGTGSHRYGTESTYAHTKNPKVVEYNIARGITYGGDWYWGGPEWSAHLLDNSTFFAAMNECDESVALKAGGTETRYEIGAEIRVNEQPVDVIDRINSSCAGRAAECGGIYKSYAGAPGASILSFTDDDIAITEESSASKFPGHESWVNIIRASFTNPNDMWQPKAVKAKTNAAYVTADGGRTLEQSVMLTYVSSNTQAQRLARIMLKEARKFKEHVIALPPDAMKIEALDTVSWTSTKFDYTAKKFTIGELRRQRNGMLIASLREVDSTDHDWTALTDEDDFSDGVYGDIEPATDIIAITATAVSTTNNAGTATKPAIKIVWTVDADVADVTAVRYQVRDATTLAVVARGRTDDWDDGEIIITAPSILRSQNYEVRARWVTDSGRLTDWCTWEAATVPDVGETVTAADIAAGAITTSKLATSTVISKGSFKGSDSRNTTDTTLSIGTTNVATVGEALSINNPNPSPVIIDFEYSAAAGIYADIDGKTGAASAILYLLRGATKLMTISAKAELNHKTIKVVTKRSRLVFFDFNPPSGTSTYKMSAKYKYNNSIASGYGGSVGVGGTVKMIWWKR